TDRTATPCARTSTPCARRWTSRLPPPCFEPSPASASDSCPRMKHSPSLRRRIVGAYLLLALFLGAVFSAIGFKTLETIENLIVDQRLQEAADMLIDDKIRGIDHPLPGYPMVLRGPELTSAFRELPPGLHELRYGHHHVHVLVRERGSERYAVVEDESEFE